MKSVFNVLGLGFVFLLVVFSFGRATASELSVGDIAPNFSLASTFGEKFTLSDFRGKQGVVIAWFPKAYTRGCTIECKSLAENGHLLKKHNVQYVMASVDPIEDNIGFAEAQKADFPLLSDPSKEVARSYGVLNLLGFANRVTFYIGVDGKILKIDSKIHPKTSAEDIAEALNSFNL
ncbi:MAG: peroxiredoxin Q/BCP [Flavobacteriales bacterium]|jgi:peroxiredoxin Q/BCP